MPIGRIRTKFTGWQKSWRSIEMENFSVQGCRGARAQGCKGAGVLTALSDRLLERFLYENVQAFALCLSLDGKPLMEFGRDA